MAARRGNTICTAIATTVEVYAREAKGMGRGRCGCSGWIAEAESRLCSGFPVVFLTVLKEGKDAGTVSGVDVGDQ